MKFIKLTQILLNNFLYKMAPLARSIYLKLEIGCKQGFQYTPRKIIIVHKQWSKNGYVKNAVNLSKIIFSSL